MAKVMIGSSARSWSKAKYKKTSQKLSKESLYTKRAKSFTQLRNRMFLFGAESFARGLQGLEGQKFKDLGLLGSKY